MLPLIRTHRTTPRSTMNTLFNDDFFSNFFDLNKDNSYSNLPAVNIEENDKSFVIDVVAAGIDKKDFKVSVDNDTLTISSEKENNTENEEKGFIRKEFAVESFSRSFTLPENTDASKIKASHKNGILSIDIPKVKVETQKAIEVKIN